MNTQNLDRRRTFEFRMPATALLALAFAVWGAAPLSAAPPGQASAVGIVAEAPEFSTCQQGATHLLMDGDDVSYQLVAARPSLDLSLYEGRLVSVRGQTLEPIEGCAPLMRVQQVRALDRHGSTNGDGAVD